MTRFLLAVPLLLIVSAASAQSGRPDPGCARDVSRVFPASDGPGRHGCSGLSQAKSPPRLSKACAKVLTDHGQ